ncbi:MAG TPA: Na/Pi symporter [Alphaproteobacteria bacterium]|nr:Na/Pi symporter [Alphaproteobacteria bacterium]
MFLIKLAAGLALIVFGVRFLRKGLDRLLDGQLIVWLEKTTCNRIQALASGMVAGVLTPSSTALSLLSAQIVGNGKANAEKMLAVLMGANIGMTVLANIAALQFGNYAGVLLCLGVIGFQFAKLEWIRGVGQCFLSLGFIFVAMNFLKEGANDFISSQDVNVVFGVLDHHPYLICVIAAILAVLLQSSTATVCMGIGLAAGGVLPESLFVNWIIGTNIGLGFTSLFVSRTNVEARRLGWVNLLAKIMVSVLITALVPAKVFSVAAASLPVPQQLALMHTAFNVVVALVALALPHGWLAVLKRILVPDTPYAEEQPKTFLNPEALETPSIALAHATREALRMTDAVKVMLQNVWAAHTQKSAGQAKDIRTQEDAIDDINQQLTLYLSGLGEMNRFDRKWHFTLLSYSNELETIGDIIEKNLSGTVGKELVESFSLNPEDEAALNSLNQKTLLQFDLAVGFVTARETIAAQKLVKAKDEINAWCLAQKKIHYERLKPGDTRAISGSLCFLDMLEALRRICEHLSMAAYGFESTGMRSKKTKVKAPRKDPLTLPTAIHGHSAPENPQTS